MGHSLRRKNDLILIAIGTPLSDLQTLPKVNFAPLTMPIDQLETTISKRALPPSNIRFVRHRMLYGKPILNAKGLATVGLRPVRM